MRNNNTNTHGEHKATRCHEAAAARLETTDLENQEMHWIASQQTETKHSPHGQPDMCSLEDTLTRSKQINDGQVPEALQHLAATKEDINTKQDKKAGNDSNKHGNQAKQCASVPTTTTAATQHQQLQNTATMPSLTASSRPPRPLVQPASAADSVRRHYVSPTLPSTTSRLTANSVANSLRQQSNDVTNAGSAQPEDLVTAVPVEEDEVHGYAVSHDVSLDEIHKKVQMVRVRRYSRRLYFLFFCLVAAAVLIASLVVLSRNNKSDGQEQVQGTEMTVLQNMTQLITSIMGADAVLLKDASSPYAKALTWLLQSIERNESQVMFTTLAQRFYLASFYFDTTTDVDKWSDCNPPNSSSDLDQTCYNMYFKAIAQAWLSDSHECEWSGVVCDKHQQIIELGLEDMNLVGTIPSSVAKFPFLQALGLLSSRLKGNISLLSNCHHLTYILLVNNSLSEDLSSVWQHQNLAHLEIDYNYLTGSLSFQIGNLVDLKVLSLDGNELTGTVPSKIGWLDSITSFYIGDNSFRGALPPSMQLWNMIEWFDARGNSFSGPIPTFLGQFNATLQWLNLYGNSFTGTLPDELFHLSELFRLDVSNNELSGTLDARFAQMTSLQQNSTLGYLGLSGNHFSGTIPSELGLLTDLSIIYLNVNDLTGSVPASLCRYGVYTYYSFVADCSKDDNGQVELQCDCCTDCCQADGTQCKQLAFLDDTTIDDISG